MLFSSLIYKIFESFTDVYGFYIAYVYEVVFYDDDLWEEVGEDVDSRLLDLAASKINIDEVPRDLATKFREFKSRVKEEYTDWLNLVKRKSFPQWHPTTSGAFGHGL